ncbi:MAG: hypothetical protein ACO1QR_11450 [Chthoniobacteraceae bacterium]
MDELTDERRKAIEKSIHTIGVEELKALGEGLFPYSEHPWREAFFSFIAQNTNATFYHATTHDRVHIVYCPDQDKGIWFTPGSGTGPLQEKGRRILSKIVAGKP